MSKTEPLRSPNVNKFFALINNKCKERNITQKEIAERIGISESLLSKVLAGERTLKSEKLKELATFLEIDFDILIDKAIGSGVVSSSTLNTIESFGTSSGSFISSLFGLAVGMTKKDISLSESESYVAVTEDLSIKDLKLLASEALVLKDKLEKLKTFNNALNYSLKGKVSDEFIEKIQRYIELEIQLNRQNT